MGLGTIHRFIQSLEDDPAVPVGLSVHVVREDDPVTAPNRTTAEGDNIKPIADGKGRLWGRVFVVDDDGVIINPAKDETVAAAASQAHSDSLLEQAALSGVDSSVDAVKASIDLFRIENDANLDAVNAELDAQTLKLIDIDDSLGDTTDPEATGDGTLIAIAKRLRTRLDTLISTFQSEDFAQESTQLLNLAQLQAINADLDVALSTRASEATLAAFKAENDANLDAANAKLADIDDSIGDTTDAEATADGTVIAILKRLRTRLDFLITQQANEDFATESTLLAFKVENDANLDAITTQLLLANTSLDAIEADADFIRIATQSMDTKMPANPRKEDGHGATAGLPTHVRPLDPVVPSAIGTNSFDTSQGSPIPTNGSPWLGTYEDVSAYVAQAIVLKASAASGVVKGIVRFSYKRDGTTTVIPISELPVSVTDAGIFIPVPLMNVGPFFKADFVPDASAPAITSAAMTVLHYRTAPPDLTRFQTQVIGPGEPTKVVRALVEPSTIGERGLLGADREVFGAAIVGSRIDRIVLNPTKAIANNRVDIATGTSGGTVTQVAAFAEFRLSTGAGTSNTARLTSLVINKYRPGHEMFLIVPARFTAGIANSHQRVGLFTDTDGFFFGYQGTTFGFTVRKNSVDTFTALTAANGDPLDGTGNSRFNRGGVLETYDATKKNIWRVRVGLLGSSNQFFDLQSPDGLWMRVHTNRFPNLQTDASIYVWELPFRAEIVKSTAGATDLIVGVGSVSSGFVGDPYGLEPSGVWGREHYEVVIDTTAAAIKDTPPAGTVFVAKQISWSAENSDTTAALRVHLRDNGVAGTKKYGLFVDESTGGLGGINNVDNGSCAFPEGRRFATNLATSVDSGSLAAITIIVTGYLEAA